MRVASIDRGAPCRWSLILQRFAANRPLKSSADLRALMRFQRNSQYSGPSTAVRGDSLRRYQPARLFFRDQHRFSFADLLGQFWVSLAVTTRPSCQFAMLPAADGTVNTHSCNFNQTTGRTPEGGRLAVCTAIVKQEFHNAPVATRALDITGGDGADGVVPSEPYGLDSFCVPLRGWRATDDVQALETARAADSLWGVVTPFSCVFSRDSKYRSVPRWRVSDLTALALCAVGAVLFSVCTRKHVCLKEPISGRDIRQN